MSKGKILILDDSPTTIAMVQSVLSEAGYAVVAETSAFLLNKRVRTENPDLILMDLEMPALSGEHLVAACQKSSWFGKVPVVYYSAAPTEALDDLAHRTGAVGYIPKDTAPARLVELVGLYLRTKKRPRGSAPAGPAPSAKRS